MLVSRNFLSLCPVRRALDQDGPGRAPVSSRMNVPLHLSLSWNTMGCLNSLEPFGSIWTGIRKVVVWG